MFRNLEQSQIWLYKSAADKSMMFATDNFEPKRERR